MPIGTPVDLGFGGVLTGSSFTITTTDDIATGDLVPVMVVVGSGHSPVSSITDGTNSYVLDGTFVPSNDMEVWDAISSGLVPAGSGIVVNNPDAAATMVGTACHVTGIAQVSPYDSGGAATGNGTGTNASVTTGTLAQASEIILAYTIFPATSTFTEDPNFTTLSQPNALGLVLSTSYLIVSSTAPVTYAPSFNAPTTNWAIFLAPFKGLAPSDTFANSQMLLVM